MDEYRGRPIKKRVVNLGTGGVIELPPTLLDAEPESIVSFTVNARLGADKHKFEDDGSVTMSVILTLDASTFDVQKVEAPEPRPEQGTLDDDDEMPEGEATPSDLEGD